MSIKIKMILLFALAFIIASPLVKATFNGNDDGFHNSVIVTATDNLCTVTFTGNLTDFEAPTIATQIGSFDDPDDTGTARTPFSVNYTLDFSAGCLGADNSARLRIHETESCASATIVDNTFTVEGTGLRFDQSTGWDSFTGTHCVNVTVVADDNALGDTITNDITGRIGTAPFLNAPTIAYNTINLFETQTITHNLESAEQSDITNLRFILVRNSDGTSIKTQETDTAPVTTFDEQLITFSPNPILNTNHSYRYDDWTDDAVAHTRFSTNSLNSASGSLPNSPPFNITDIIFCKDIFIDDSIRLYNKGETTQRSGIINRYSNASQFNVTASVSFDILFRKFNDATTQFSDLTFDVNATGGWDRGNQITSTSFAGFNLSGLPYDMFFQVDNDADSTEQMNCTYLRNFNVSSMLQVSTIHPTIDGDTNVDVSPKIYNRGETVDFNAYLYNVRGQNLTSRINMIFNVMNATNGIHHGVSTEATNGTGFIERALATNRTWTATNDLVGHPFHIAINDSFNNAVSWNNSAYGTNSIKTFNVSSLLRIGSVNNSINDLVNATPFSIYNRGETVAVNFSVFGVRDNLYTTRLTASVLNTTNRSEENLTISSFQSSFNLTYLINESDEANNTLSGSRKRLRLNFSDGNFDVNSSESWNVSSFYLANVHAEIDSSRASFNSSLTFPNQNESGQSASAIIAADVVFIWGELMNIRGTPVNDTSVLLGIKRPDLTIAESENQTTGADAITTNFFDKATEAPSGVWSAIINASSKGNYGFESDSIEFISPYTGNIGKQCYVLPRIGNQVPSNTWSINDNVTIRCEYRIVNNFVDTRTDTDNNDTRLDIEIVYLNGTQQILFDDAQMTRVSLGKYDFNVTLNTSNGFIENRTYIGLGNTKISSRDILTDTLWYITFPQTGGGGGNVTNINTIVNATREGEILIPKGKNKHPYLKGGESLEFG